MYKEKQKQANREAKQRQRQGMTKGAMDGMTSVGMTLLKRPNGADYDPDELMADGTLRYIGPFTDGQVLDNTTVGLNLTP